MPKSINSDHIIFQTTLTVKSRLGIRGRLEWT